MLYEKYDLITISDETLECIGNNNEVSECPERQLVAPFPFKVAKALDPNIYRNIEFDSWGETRRGKNTFLKKHVSTFI